MKNKFPFYKDVQLPGTGTYVHLVCHHFLEMVQSLLSDPRITDADYLFGDDPFALPEDLPAAVQDLNTGIAYRTAYKKYITDPTGPDPSNLAAHCPIYGWCRHREFREPACHCLQNCSGNP